MCGANHHHRLWARCAISYKLRTYLCACGGVQLAHMAAWATEVEESPQTGGQVGEMVSSPVIQMDEREVYRTMRFAWQPYISAGYMPVLCCLSGHDVFFSHILLL